MSKAHRGAGIRDQIRSGRGDCPLCKRTAIKVGYAKDFDGKKVNICKQCNAAVSNGKMKEAVAAL